MLTMGRALGGVVLAVAGLLVAACNDTSSNAPDRQRQNLTPAKRFEHFALYHAGISHRGLFMTSDGTEDIRGYRGARPVTFVYGECTPDPAGDSESCAPRLALSNWPLCDEYPALYDDRPPQRRTRIRGVPAAVWFDHGRVFDKLELYTGKTTIEVHANGLDEARAVVGALRSADGAVDQTERLPPPTRGFREPTTQRCRRATR